MSLPFEAVRAHLEAFNARDPEAVVATFTDDAVFAAGEQIVVGRRALHTMFADAFGAPIHARLDVRQAVVDEQTVACELTETITVEGATHELDVAAFYRVRDGLLSRVKVYRDLTDPS